MGEDALVARVRMGEGSLQQWHDTAKSIVDVHTLHSFMFLEHTAYCSKKHAVARGDVRNGAENATRVDADVLKSY